MRRQHRHMRPVTNKPYIQIIQIILPPTTSQCKDHSMPSIVHIFAGGERKVILDGTTANEYSNFSRGPGATFCNKKSEQEEQEQEELVVLALAEEESDSPQGHSIPCSPAPPNTTTSYRPVPSACCLTTPLPHFAQTLLVPPATPATTTLETTHKRKRGFCYEDDLTAGAGPGPGVCDDGARIAIKDDAHYHSPEIDHYNHNSPSSTTVAGEKWTTIIDMQHYQQTDEQKRKRGYLSSDEEDSSLDDDSHDFGADSIDGKSSDSSGDETSNRSTCTFDEKNKREEEDLLSSDKEDESSILEGTDSTDDNIIDASTTTIPTPTTPPTKERKIVTVTDDSSIQSIPKSLRRVNITFEERCDQLLRFKEEFGHCNVPARYKEMALGKWCSNMRTSYKRVRIGLKPPLKLTQERIKRMEVIGFQFSTFRGPP